MKKISIFIRGSQIHVQLMENRKWAKQLPKNRRAIIPIR
jgi:hypothetical protein